jgi:hypothetical protein
VLPRSVASSPWGRHWVTRFPYPVRRRIPEKDSLYYAGFNKVVVYISHMRYIQRRLAGVLLDAARHFPAVVVTGPRRAGKTTLLRRLFPKAHYVLLEEVSA